MTCFLLFCWGKRKESKRERDLGELVEPPSLPGGCCWAGGEGGDCSHTFLKRELLTCFYLFSISEF